MTPRALLAALALAPGLIAGCGGDGDAPRPAQGPTGAAFELPKPLAAREWSADAEPETAVEGRLTIDGEPVAGAQIRVGGYVLWARTDEDGAFTYPLDVTLPRRHPVAVASTAGATVDGEELSPDQEAALAGVSGAITVGHALDDVEGVAEERGITVSGRVLLGEEPVQPVALDSYELSGTVRDARGRPVKGAIVSTRTSDRDFWTFSDPSDARGRYRSNFGASDRIGSNPVPITVHVAVGDREFAFLPEETVEFERLKSAEMDIGLPPEGFSMALPEPRSYEGARYKGVVVGASADGRVVRPVRATWPDEDGRFELVLPARLAGATVALWAGDMSLLSRRAARPGTAIDLRSWPRTLPPRLPRDLRDLELPDD